MNVLKVSDQSDPQLVADELAEQLRRYAVVELHATTDAALVKATKAVTIVCIGARRQGIELICNPDVSVEAEKVTTIRLIVEFRSPIVMNIKNDNQFVVDEVPMSKLVSHQNWKKYLCKIGNKQGMNILEIGSREVTGQSSARKEFYNANYIGFDYYLGENVDVVGDAHKLSSYFEKEKKFDIIYSSACFEHFAMPWIVATEIAKLLNVGGVVFIETHFAYIAHERPWHFFQFSDMALRTLFSPALGFECIEAGMSNPICGRFSSLADDYLRNKNVVGLYCHSAYLGKKTRNVEDFSWEALNLLDVVGETKYPEMV